MDQDLGKAAGFYAAADLGHLKFRLPGWTMHRRAAPLVSFARSPQFSCVLLGRLYYKADLPPCVRVDVVEGRDGDAALVLGLYAKAGATGLSHLEGDFCVVLFDHRRRQFVARRDPLGAYPLYLSRQNGSVAFATGLGEFATTQAVCPADYLADFIMGTQRRDRDAYQACALPSIERVGTDAILCVDVATRRAQHIPCWDWREKSIDPSTDKVDEIARRYAPLLQAAVEERVVGHTAAHLSGGMDSTSTCLLAHRYAKSAGHEPPVRFLSLVYKKLPTLALERSFIDRVADDPEIGLLGDRLNGDDDLHFDMLRDPIPHDEPCSALWAMEQNRVIMRRAADLQIDSLLTGEGADDLLDPMPQFLSDLVATRQLGAAWHGARRWAIAQGSNPWSVLRQFGMARIPLRRADFISRLFRLGHSFKADKDRWSVPSWIDPDFARRHALAERGAAEWARTNGLAPTSVSAHALKGIEMRSDNPDGAILFAPKGIHVAHPFLDPRVIALALGINQRARTPARQRKPVLAEAMRGVLPDSIRTRSDKRGFNEVLYLGYQRNLQAIEQMIAASHGLGLFDCKALIACLHEAAVGIAAPSTLRRLNESLSLVAWFTHRHRWSNRPSCYERNISIQFDDASRVHRGNPADDGRADRLVPTV